MIQQYHIQQTKHELADQIKQMHLRENALLKNEMKEKLSQLESLGTGALSQPKLLLAKNLGLMADEDLWKSHLKDRMHEPEEEIKRKEEIAKQKVEKWV